MLQVYKYVTQQKPFLVIFPQFMVIIYIMYAQFHLFYVVTTVTLHKIKSKFKQQCVLGLLACLPLYVALVY